MNEHATSVGWEWAEGYIDCLDLNGMTLNEIEESLKSGFYEEFDSEIDNLSATLRSLLYDDEINWREIASDIYDTHNDEIDSEINAFFSNSFVLSHRTAFASETLPPTLEDNLYYFIGEYMDQDWYEDYGIGTYQYDIDEGETEGEYLDRLIEEVKDIAAEHNHVLRIDGATVKFAKIGSVANDN